MEEAETHLLDCVVVKMVANKGSESLGVLGSKETLGLTQRLLSQETMFGLSPRSLVCVNRALLC